LKSFNSTYVSDNFSYHCNTMHISGAHISPTWIWGRASNDPEARGCFPENLLCVIDSLIIITPDHFSIRWIIPWATGNGCL